MKVARVVDLPHYLANAVCPEKLNNVISGKLSPEEELAFMMQSTPICHAIIKLTNDGECGEDIEIVACNSTYAQRFDLTPEAARGKRFIRDFGAQEVVKSFWLQIYHDCRASESKIIEAVLRAPFKTQINVPIKNPGAFRYITIRYLGLEDIFSISVSDATSLFMQELQNTTDSASCEPFAASEPTNSADDPSQSSNPSVVFSPEKPRGAWEERTLKGLVADLSAAENIYKALEEAELVGLCVFDKTGRIYSCNNKYHELMGFDAPRKEWSVGRTQKQIDTDAKALQDIEKYGKATPYERTVTLPDGREITSWVVAMSLEPDKPFEQNSKGLALLMDITIQKQAQEAISQASAMKSTFLSTVSHEIRSPLSSVISLLELMQDSANCTESPVVVSPRKWTASNFSSCPLPMMFSEMLATSLSSCKSLLLLLNDLLDAAKGEAGKLELRFCEFDIREIVEESIAVLGELANNKQLEIYLRLHPSIPGTLWGDPQRLRQCIVNCLSNAIKFSHSNNSVEVDVQMCDVGQSEHSASTASGHDPLSIEIPGADAQSSAESSAQMSQTKLLFSITDHGIGIAEEDQQKLFQPFSQIDSSLSRKFAGTGLGLVILKRLVEMMNGEISVCSKIGQGSTFSFSAQFGIVHCNQQEPLMQTTRSIGLITLPSCDQGESVSTCASDKELDEITPAGRLETPERRSHIFSLLEQWGFKDISCFDSLSHLDELITEAVLEQKESCSGTSLGTAFIIDIPVCCSESTLRDVHSLLQKYFLPPAASGNQHANLSDENGATPTVSMLFICSTAVQHKICSWFKNTIVFSGHNSDSKIDQPCLVVPFTWPSSEGSKKQLLEATLNLFIVNKPLKNSRLQHILHFALSEQQKPESPVEPGSQPQLLESASKSSRAASSPNGERRIFSEELKKEIMIAAAAVQQSTGEKRILIAEDNVVMAKVIAMQLKKLGYSNFTIFPDGQKLVDAFQAEALAARVLCGIGEQHDNPIALILTDQMMPEKDGFTAAKEIREMERAEGLQACPIVCMTADAHTDAAIRAREADINECLTKPVSLLQLESTLDKWI